MPHSTNAPVLEAAVVDALEMRRHDDEVVALLEEAGYGRWLVLEQDLAITGSEPPANDGPALDVRRSIEYLSNSAPRRERVSQT